MGRYRDTRGWISAFGTLLSSGMEYHFIQHLLSSSPLNRTLVAYREMKPLLEAEGMSLNGLEAAHSAQAVAISGLFVGLFEPAQGQIELQSGVLHFAHHAVA